MRKRPLMTACILFLMIRYMIFLAGEEGNLPPEVYSMEGKSVCVTGVIEEKARREKGPTWYIRSGKSRYVLYDSKERDLKIGNSIQVTGVFYLFDKASNPGEFDSRSYYQRQQIYGSIIPKTIKLKDDNIIYWKEWLFRLRESWKEELIRRLGQDKGAVLSGILLGDKSSMEPETKELYQKNGIAHLLAVSGLHVSFVGVFVYKRARKAGIPFAAAAAAGMSVLLPYAVMTGFSVSARRAVLMFACRMGAQVSGRVYDMPTSLALSAAVILGLEPLYLKDAGFLLSFGAILALWGGGDITRRQRERAEERREKKTISEPLKMKKKPGFLAKIREAAWSGFCVQALTFPVLLSSYYEFPLYSILINMWVIPMMSVVMGAGLFGSILCVVCPFLADVPLAAAKAVLSFYEWNCQIMLKFPFARVITGCPALWQSALYLLVIILIFFGVARWKKKILVSIFLFAGIILLGNWKTFDCRMEVTVVDVGQGDGIFIKSPGNRNILIDGGSTTEEELAKYTLEPFLESRGVGELDYVFVSHGDEDHISGIRDMLKRQEVGVKIHCLVLPEKRLWDEVLLELAREAVRQKVEIKEIREGETVWDKKGMEIRCVGPSSSYDGEKGNAASMLLKLTYGNFSMLFTGDMEGDGEESFLADMKRRQTYSILKVAHHGSKGGTTDEFLKKNHAGLAVISAGQGNRYGHPSKETVKRLEEQNIPYLCTKECGAITVRTDGETMTVEKYLGDQ